MSAILPTPFAGHSRSHYWLLSSVPRRPSHINLDPSITRAASHACVFCIKNDRQCHIRALRAPSRRRPNTYWRLDCLYCADSRRKACLCEMDAQLPLDRHGELFVQSMTIDERRTLKRYGKAARKRKRLSKAPVAAAMEPRGGASTLLQLGIELMSGLERSDSSVIEDPEHAKLEYPCGIRVAADLPTRRNGSRRLAIALWRDGIAGFDPQEVPNPWSFEARQTCRITNKASTDTTGCLASLNSRLSTAATSLSATFCPSGNDLVTSDEDNLDDFQEDPKHEAVSDPLHLGSQNSSNSLASHLLDSAERSVHLLKTRAIVRSFRHIPGPRSSPPCLSVVSEKPSYLARHLQATSHSAPLTPTLEHSAPPC